MPGALLPWLIAPAAALAVALLDGPELVPMALAVGSAGSLAVGAIVAMHRPVRTGAADLVTSLRLVMALAIATLALFDPIPGPLILATALLALASDGVDGWLARRAGRATEFGARLDMETDTILLAAVALFALDKAGPIVLLAPLLRPAWLFAGHLLPWLGRPLAPSLRRRAACVLPILLLALAPWPVSHAAGQAMGWAAVLVLLISFGIDFARQWQHHRATTQAGLRPTALPVG